MADSRKVFIYNAEGTGPLSTADLNELFTTGENIFTNQPDVSLRNFDFNVDGLENPVFVVPGGSTSLIGKKLKPQIDKIKSSLGENFSYVGVCAGAFLGTTDAQLYYTTHELDSIYRTYQPAVFVGSTKTMEMALGMIDGHEAIGAFYPNDSQLGATPKTLMPYHVTLSLTKDNKQLSQLYVAGPGFISCKKDEEKHSSEIVATYVDHRNYTVYGKQKVDQLAAIIRTSPQEKKGGRFLSATHIETCVEKSKLLNLFKSDGKNNASLNKNEHDLLTKEQKNLKSQVESLLHESLKLHS